MAESVEKGSDPVLSVAPDVAGIVRPGAFVRSGLTVLAFMAWGAPSGVCLVLLVEAIIPVGDMLLILAAKGSTKSAFGMHGLTAVIMVLAAVSLIIGAA